MAHFKLEEDLTVMKHGDTITVDGVQLTFVEYDLHRQAQALPYIARFFSGKVWLHKEQLGDSTLYLRENSTGHALMSREELSETLKRGSFTIST